MEKKRKKRKKRKNRKVEKKNFEKKKRKKKDIKKKGKNHCEFYSNLNVGNSDFSLSFRNVIIIIHFTTITDIKIFN